MIIVLFPGSNPILERANGTCSLLVISAYIINQIAKLLSEGILALVRDPLSLLRLILTVTRNTAQSLNESLLSAFAASWF